MSTLVSAIETKIRLRLDEPTARFWSSDEMVGIIDAGIRDLWRPMVDLKQEYFLTIDITNVSLDANTSTLTGIPADVHKIYHIEPLDTTVDSGNRNLKFEPLDYNHVLFESARGSNAINPSNDVIYYTITGAGAPVSAPTVTVAPQVNDDVDLRFTYVPTLGAITAASTVPLPGEVDNALVAWGVAYARAKEREDLAPDPGWLGIYYKEKEHLLQSLGVRNLHKNVYAEAVFGEYW